MGSSSKQPRLDITGVGALAQSITALRLDLERQREKEGLRDALSKDFISNWLPEIAKAAMKGMTACAVLAVFPPQEYRNLYQTRKNARKSAISKLVQAFLEGSGITAGFADWRIEPGSSEPLSVQVLLSWRATGRA